MTTKTELQTEIRALKESLWEAQTELGRVSTDYFIAEAKRIDAERAAKAEKLHEEDMRSIREGQIPARILRKARTRHTAEGDTLEVTLRFHMLLADDATRAAYQSIISNKPDLAVSGNISTSRNVIIDGGYIIPKRAGAVL